MDRDYVYTGLDALQYEGNLLMENLCGFFAKIHTFAFKKSQRGYLNFVSGSYISQA